MFLFESKVYNFDFIKKGGNTMKRHIIIILCSILLIWILSASNCADDEYPNIAGTWNVTMTKTGTTCIFDEELTVLLTAVITQSGGSGKITLYYAEDTDLETALITYNYTLETDGTIKILETATYNVWEDGFPAGTTSAMSVDGTITETTLTSTFAETITVPLVEEVVPEYVCTRTGTINGTKI
jgi:hypothetical protein